MTSDVMNVKFISQNPTLSLTPITPEKVSLEFIQAVVGKDGKDTGQVDVDEVEGFTTDPIFYYILNRD